MKINSLIFQLLFETFLEIAGKRTYGSLNCNISDVYCRLSLQKNLWLSTTSFVEPLISFADLYRQ
jgi:hypothetical protein